MNCAGTLPAGSPFANYSNICGGLNSISLWNNTAYKPAQYVAAVGSYVSQGCYAEGKSGRALTSLFLSNSTITVENCVGYCKGKAFKWAGVEYGSQCFCGSGISNGAVLATDGNVGCNMPCAGNKYEFCGGPNRLNVYSSN